MVIDEQVIFITKNIDLLERAKVKITAAL